MRRGFTMLELLVVVVIIGVLAAGLTMAVLSLVTDARAAATRGTVTTISGLMQQRIEAYRRTVLPRIKNAIANDSMSVRITSGTTPQSVPLNSCGDRQLAQVLAEKVYFRNFFPQTWAEASYLLAQAGQSAPVDTREDTESAEVLYFLLTDAGVVGNLAQDAESFSTKQVADTDGNGRNEFVDGWGNPIRFYRWPTRLIRPFGYAEGVAPTATDLMIAKTFIPALPHNPLEAAVDPDDHLEHTHGGCFDADWFENEFHTLASWHSPLIVSCGPDQSLGMFETSDRDNYGHLGRLTLTYGDAMDNITNFNCGL